LKSGKNVTKNFPFMKYLTKIWSGW